MDGGTNKLVLDMFATLLSSHWPHKSSMCCWYWVLVLLVHIK